MKSQHKIDDSGRVSFPVKLREALGESFHIVKSSNEKCLLVLSETGWQEVIDRINAVREPADARNLKRKIDADSQEVELDKLGRIVINLDLRQYAEIADQKEVVITGLMEKDKAEIWSVANWEAKHKEIEANTEIQQQLASFGI